MPWGRSCAMGEKRSFWHFLTLPASEPATPQEYFARLPMIDTPRLTLRKMRMSDAPAVFSYARDPEVARHVLWEAHQSVWDTRAYIRYLLWQYRSGLPSSWAIELKETGKVVGTIGYMSYNADNATVEVGYSLAREQWGKGLMTEALTAVIAETFRALDMHRIEAMHFTDNPASGRVMAKCGMTHEGHLRERVCCKGAFRDVEMWGILYKDWKKSQA